MSFVAYPLCQLLPHSTITVDFTCLAHTELQENLGHPIPRQSLSWSFITWKRSWRHTYLASKREWRRTGHASPRNCPQILLIRWVSSPPRQRVKWRKWQLFSPLGFQKWWMLSHKPAGHTGEKEHEHDFLSSISSFPPKVKTALTISGWSPTKAQIS